ncbi:hypothetical protein BCV70DRAFT_31229 [Testicularia cyperi]|uniref:Uncharacterized protein n=1 Tax=Testicularia cyperi TaxID=1882483 RepID=A0A317XJA0_9BASI|nr:hypothetical protein BCV70DRAFT_31229 [Testicularia cyperi]
MIFRADLLALQTVVPSSPAQSLGMAICLSAPLPVSTHDVCANVKTPSYGSKASFWLSLKRAADSLPSHLIQSPNLLHRKC